MEPYDIIIIVFLALFGACLASFINVAALRGAKKESFITGRSRCPSCSETLRWFELIPVLSWIIQAGQCRNCKARISPRYLLTELTGAAASALCYVSFGIAWMTPVAFVTVMLLLAAALFDYGMMEIPNGLILVLIIPAGLAAWLQPEISLVSRAIGFAAVSIPMLILALVINGAFGGGDIKLMAVCGFLLGWQNVLLAFLIAVVIAGVYSIAQILRKKATRKSRIAFGPYLCFGTTAAMLFGSEIISGYFRLYGVYI